jgi:hypothetical protein
MTSNKLLPELYLHGGLGNQMFQIATMVYKYGQNNFVVNFSLKNNIHHLKGPNISDSNLKNSFQFVDKPSSAFLYEKIINYSIRLSSRSDVRTFKIRILIAILKTLLSNLYLNGREIIINNGIGFGTIDNSSVNPFIIGYYQSYVWLTDPSVKNMFLDIKFSDQGEQLENFTERAMAESPLVVHIRLGDYRSDLNLGHLSDQYYISNLIQEWDSGVYKKIWIFSDEINLAKKIIPPYLIPYCVWVDDEITNPATIFQIMRLGRGYILSNSTFGWWAASLSNNLSPRVIVPKPWFKNQQNPTKLIPAKWVQNPAI